ncbi:MoaA/NifB/PqqE/SkfB family radical SAM enzyme [Pantoea alhagi]|uniref:radical SAM/SPASM domain-containing protein n=1 Tax=Mixta sp. BE291 TaxID=3158787 RepID=UPI00285FB0B9|nr:MoaA/NifB/PqqE/SkfB family radical SAM enzyme [Pantoea alhagi]
MNYFEQIIFASDDNIKNLLDSRRSASLSASQQAILFKRHVEIVNMELSYSCNRKCDYCPVSFSNRQSVQRYMDLAALEKVCRELAEIRYENRISLNLYNEPLLDLALEKKIALVKQYLPYSHIAFNSNGDYLDLARLETLADSGLNNICVTLHPPSNRTQTAAAIFRRVTKLLEKLACENKVNDFTLDSVTEKQSVQFRHKGVQIKIQWPDWRQNGTNRAGVLTEHVASSTIRTQPCVKPFREFTIFYDGTVQPCCESFLDDKTNLAPAGNIHTATIFEIYAAKTLSNFRRGLFDFGLKKGICASCTVADYSTPEEDVARKRILREL